MKIVNINSRRLFGFVGPRAELESEGLEFLTKAALTFIVPAIAFAWTMDSAVLLLCLLVEQVIGGVCGWLLHKLPARPPLSCVPVDINPNVPARKLKKAA